MELVLVLVLVLEPEPEPGLGLGLLRVASAPMVGMREASGIQPMWLGKPPMLRQTLMARRQDTMVW